MPPGTGLFDDVNDFAASTPWLILLLRAPVSSLVDRLSVSSFRPLALAPPAIR